MRPDTFDPVDLDDLVTMLTTAGVDSASLNPGAVNLPGVWVNLVGLVPELLSGIVLRVQLVCLAPANDPRTALTHLAELLNTITPVVAGLGGPNADIIATTYVLPGSTAPVPALVVPLDLHTVHEE